MLVKSLGAVVLTECELKRAGCTALVPSPVVVVKEVFSGIQHNVCRNCLETMIKDGEWEMNNTSVRFQADFAIIPIGSSVPIIALEVKSLSWLGNREAFPRVQKWFRNQISHGSNIPTSYLMILVPGASCWVFDVENARHGHYHPFLVLPSDEILSQLEMKVDPSQEEPVLSASCNGFFEKLLNLSTLPSPPEWVQTLALGRILPERFNIVEGFSAHQG